MRLAVRARRRSLDRRPLRRGERRRHRGDGARRDRRAPALTQPVAARLLDHYFGTPGPSQASIAEWTTLLFWYLFIDLNADPDLDARAAAAAAEFRDWLDGHIAERRAEGGTKDDVLGRCLAMGTAGMPGMSDLDIRNNLIGLLIGELPTLSATANLALDELLDRPAAFANACAAARAGDDATLAAHVFEALRFRPLNPVVYRRAMRDTVIAGGRLRRRRIRKDTMVLASNLSAMFDPLVIPDATRFRTDRPWEVYMLWGYGMHNCFRRAHQPRRAAGPAQAAARPAQFAPRPRSARADRQGRHAVPAAFPPRVRHLTADRPKILTFAPMVDSETARLLGRYYGLDFDERNHLFGWVSILTLFHGGRGLIPLVYGKGFALTGPWEVAGHFDAALPAGRRWSRLASRWPARSRRTGRPTTAKWAPTWRSSPIPTCCPSAR